MARNLIAKNDKELAEARASDAGVHETVCLTCANCLIYPHACRAFPEGIPMEMRLGLNDHKEPYPGDRGIRYKQAGVATGSLDKD